MAFTIQEKFTRQWLSSPSHKANILNPNYKEIGIAVLDGFGQNNATIVVQEFGSLIPAKPVTVKNNNPKPVTTPQADETAPATKAGKLAQIESEPKVLSQSTKSQNFIESPNINGINGLSSKAVNFVLYNYDELLQNIIYGFSMVFIGIYWH